jgi:superfamily I DNA and/or RNA helicase
LGRTHWIGAHKLDEQHRMHPAIAKIVSDCFYDGTIKTNDEVEKKYRNETPPFRFSDSRLTERHRSLQGR